MFVAIVPPAEVIDSLESFVEPRREYGSLRWSDPEMFHLTLAFCQSVPDHALDEFCERLRHAGRRHAPIPLSLAGAGAFPDPDKARVLYAGVRVSGPAATALDSLSRAARSAAGVSGVMPEGQTFRPHITIARSAHPFSALRWLRVFEEYRGPHWEVGELALIQSHLGQGRARRPRYEVIETFPLAARRG